MGAEWVLPEFKAPLPLDDLAMKEQSHCKQGPRLGSVILTCGFSQWGGKMLDLFDFESGSKS